MFSSVGNVLSCKIALDMQGYSKGYAFVYFYATSSAESAIEKVNGLVVNGSKLAVSRLFTNLHVKNFGDRLTQSTLQEMFAPYGSIKAHGVLMKDGKSRGCGFVTFDSPEAAGHALLALNGKELSDGNALRVVPAPQGERNTAPCLANSGSVQVFVRNLDASIDGRRLMELFGPFGTVKEGFIVKEKGQSKGIGFVTFASSDQAARAIVAMNDRELAGKRLFVSVARGKDWKPSVPSPAPLEKANEPPLNDDLLLKSVTNPDELKSLLVHRLYPLVKECVNAQIAGRVTFQLAKQHSPTELMALAKNPKQLQSAAKAVAAAGFDSVGTLRVQYALLTAPANSAAA
uniref:Putative polyadenylate-binding protein rrm superfamily n=1 Tax=Culex tarsalis TaxID=7177 RepID=A0A1Q3EZW7_CULTA